MIIDSTTKARLNHFKRLYGKTVALALAMLIGVLLPQAHTLAFLMPYLLIVMLFFSFLDITLNRDSFNRSVFWILIANLCIAFAAYFLLRSIDADLAVVAFMTGITPTAMAAPVIMSFLEGRVDYVIASVLLTNTVISLVIPFALPVVVSAHVEISTLEVLRTTFLLVFVPLGAARAVAYLPAQAQITIRKGKSLTYYIWLINLFLTTSRASAYFLTDLSASLTIVLKIALVSLVICIINFGLGTFLGGQQFKREASQSLGQKNNSFTIWLALAFINPLVALGPTFYVLYHNIYNSFQLYTFEKNRITAYPAQVVDS